MADKPTNLNFNLQSIGTRSLLDQIFFQRALERGHTEASSQSYCSEAKVDDVLAAIPEKACLTYFPVDKRTRKQISSYLFDFGDTLIVLDHIDQYDYSVAGTSENRTKLDRIMGAIQKKLPPMRPRDPNIIPVNFWSSSPGGASYRTRKIIVPAWKDIAPNYHSTARKQLVGLMNLWPPLDVSGRLILWHGVPGTGKSYGIRALAQAWRKWCTIHYIVDPENFFGDANYMLQVILQNASSGEAAEAQPDAPGTKDEKTYEGPSWNLLIMEDSDEFLRVDAKERKGQSMARLLNLTSGLIGQGLNILVLITTNEPIGKVHKALQREGRCAANIEFSELDLEEAQAWAKKHSIPAERLEGNGRILADLYALTRGQMQLRTKTPERAFGLVQNRV